MGIIGECPKEPLPHHADRDAKEMTNKVWKHRGWKKKKQNWRPYEPTPYDLARDPKLAGKKPSDWKSLREFKANERKRNPTSTEDVCHRSFGRKTIDQKVIESGATLRVTETDHGTWAVVNDHGTILAEETSNGAAWRALERLELRKAGRKAKLYQSDAATTITRG